MSTTQTLLAADLPDRWIDTILGEQPDVLLQADTDEALSPDDMARNLAQFRATLIEELSAQPIAYTEFDDDEDDSDADGQSDQQDHTESENTTAATAN